MARQQMFSPRDEVYLNSPGFESYMLSGAAFLAILTAVFIFSIKIQFAWLFWPGLLVAVIVGYVVLKVFERREYRAKLRELEREYANKPRA
jgi:MFS superfamily sulfate permease-like transporter